MALALSLKNLSEALAAWRLPAPITVSELGSGFQGETWLVKAGDRRYVAKLCYDTQSSFEVGLRMAALVERHGIPSGDYQHELGIIDRRYAPAGAATGSGGAVAFWHVDDVHAALDRLFAMGAREYEALIVREAGFVTASVVDPFGNILGVMYNPHYLGVLESRSKG